MQHTGEHPIIRRIDTTEPLIAHVYGGTPPDFAAIAACGFAIVCVDSLAPWCTPATLAQATAHGLRVVSFPMSYRP